MLKYSKKDILNYIAGNDLPYEIDVYEANSSFMLDVIKLTKDKRIYELCDDDLKNDVVFIENLLEIFKKDFEFCYRIVNDSLNNISEVDKINLYIIMINNFKKIDDDRLYVMKLTVNLFYLENMIENYICIDKLNSREKREFGLGFLTILHDFNDKPIVKDYFAKRLLDEIYESIDLYKHIHLRFNNKEELLKIGIKKYICNSVYGYDEYLAGYIESSNVTLELENKIKKILDDFSEFEEDKLYYIVDIILDFAYDNELSILPLINYISEIFKIPKIIYIYNNMLNNNEIYEYDEMIKPSKKYLNKLKRIIKHYIETLEEIDDYIEDEKVIKLTKFKRYN